MESFYPVNYKKNRNILTYYNQNTDKNKCTQWIITPILVLILYSNNYRIVRLLRNIMLFFLSIFYHAMRMIFSQWKSYIFLEEERSCSWLLHNTIIFMNKNCCAYFITISQTSKHSFGSCVTQWIMNSIENRAFNIW